MGQSRPLFVYFRPFPSTTPMTQNEKSVDGVLGIQTRDRRMVGADKTTELWLKSYQKIDKSPQKWSYLILFIVR